MRFWSVLLTVPTDAGRFWFKENNGGERQEAAVVQALASFASDRVVVPLAVDVERGWLLSPDGGPTLQSLGEHDVPTWVRVVTEYAALQQICAGHEDHLLGAGLRDLRPEVAPDILRTLVDRLGGLPSTDRRHADRTLLDRVDAAMPWLCSAAAALADGPVPSTIEHSDLHPNNAFEPAADSRPLRFFDFGDAVWAHPFCSMLIPIRVLTDQWSCTQSDPRVQSVLDAYLSRWSPYGSVPELRALLDAALLVAPVHRADCWDRLLAHAADAVATDGEVLPTWLGGLLGPLERRR